MSTNKFFNLTCKKVAYLSSLLAMTFLPGSNAYAIEKPEYELLYKDGKIEYRHYQPYIVAETEIRDFDDYNDAANEGFRRLFDYITGDNTVESKIAMTAPVQQSRLQESSEKIAMTAPVQQSETEEGWRISFMLPGKYTMDTAPIPADDRVYLRLVPAKTMAVIRYSGRWTERNFERNRSRLLSRIESDGLSTNSMPEAAVYNPPFMPPFMRRNEILLEVNGLPDTALSSSISN